MGGFYFETPNGEEVCGANLPVRNRLLAAMIAADVPDWKIAEFDCPDCMHAEVVTDSVRGSYKKTLDFVKDHPEVTLEASVTMNWADGKSTREVVIEVLDRHLTALKEVRTKTLIVTDDFMLCGHPNMKRRRSRLSV